MTYQDYTDFHLVPRPVASVDECEAMRLPRESCGCPDCCAFRETDSEKEN